jgi:hypothetical protein
MIEIVAINLMASGTATTMTERLSNIPRTLTAANKDLRSTRTNLLSLRFFAQREVRIIAIGPEKSMKDNKIIARRAKEYISLAS